MARRQKVQIERRHGARRQEAAPTEPVPTRPTVDTQTAGDLLARIDRVLGAR